MNLWAWISLVILPLAAFLWLVVKLFKRGKRDDDFAVSRGGGSGSGTGLGGDDSSVSRGGGSRSGTGPGGAYCSGCGLFRSRCCCDDEHQSLR